MRQPGYIVFSDLKGFSTLSEPEVRTFYLKVVPELACQIRCFQESSVVWNTWGDALFSVFLDAENAVNLAFIYRDFFKTYKFADIGMKMLVPRIAAHFGEMEIYDDALIGRKNALGWHINSAARMEPVTREGEVYISKAFFNQITAERLEEILKIKCTPLGVLPLAKNFGDMDLYRLTRASEKQLLLDKLFQIDFSVALPQVPPISGDDSKTINYLKSCPTPDELCKQVLALSNTDHSPDLDIEIAKICNNFGLFEEAFVLIEKAEAFVLDVDGIGIHPCIARKDDMKLKANVLTRLGRYEQAADIVYSLWSLGVKDSDTLSMLAAQYKRKALISSSGIINSADTINYDLLKRATALYVEAFRTVDFRVCPA